MRELRFNGNGKRIDLAGRYPGSRIRLFRCQCDVAMFGECAAAGDLDGELGGSFNASFAEVASGGESPTAIGDHADAESEVFGGGGVARASVLGGETTVFGFDEPDVGEGGDALAQCGIERF